MAEKAAENVRTALENVPVRAMIENLAVAIAESQRTLDLKAVEMLREMADGGNLVEVNGQQYSMIELGFRPSFYHFTEATLELRVAFSATASQDWGVAASIGGGGGVPGVAFVAASISAHYSNAYSFRADGSSVISTKIVSVPPPEALERLTRDLRR